MQKLNKCGEPILYLRVRCSENDGIIHFNRTILVVERIVLLKKITENIKQKCFTYYLLKNVVKDFYAKCLLATFSLQRFSISLPI